MKRTLTAAVAIAAALLLAGCATTAEPTNAEPSTSPTAAPTTEPTSTPTPTSSPTPTAAPVEVQSMPEPEPVDEAAEVLTTIQIVLANRGVEISADQVRSAANYACDQLSAGVPMDQVAALSGDIEPWIVVEFVDLAEGGYCPVR